MNPLYEARDLRKCYGSHTALFLPSFRLEHGQSLALTGRNGSGKSTLLRLLAFLEQPTSGTLHYGGNDRNPRQEVTLLLQEPYLLKENIFKNVTLGLRLRGDKDDLHARFDQVMLDAGFASPADFASRRPHQLSGGERQRIALASRLILSPRVLLLDEPTSNVDDASAKAIIEALQKIRAKGSSVICSTHEKELITALELPCLQLSAA